MTFLSSRGVEIIERFRKIRLETNYGKNSSLVLLEMNANKMSLIDILN